MRIHCPPHRRAFTLVLVPCLLAVAMIALGVIYAVQNQKPIVPNAPQQPAIKVLCAATAFACWMVVMASGWAERRTRLSANLIFGAILLLGNLAMLNAVTGWSARMRARNQPIAFVPPVAPRPGPQMQPAPQPPSPQPAASPSPDQPRVTPDRPQAQSPAPAAAPSTDPAALAGIATRLTERLEKEAAARADDADAVFKTLANPRHDRKQLNEQIEMLRAKKGALHTASDSFRDTLQAFTNEADAAQIPKHDSIPAALKFSSEFQGFDRSIACGSAARACDAGIELFTLLHDNITKWSYNAKNEITTKDKDFQRKLFAPNAQLDFALRDHAKTVDTIRRGK